MIGGYQHWTIAALRSLFPSSYSVVLDKDSEEGPDEVKMASSSIQDSNSTVRSRVGIAAFILFLTAVILGISTFHVKDRFVSFSPNFRYRQVTFEHNEVFAGKPSAESNAAWDSLIPEGHGYVLIPNAREQYGLLPGIRTNEGPDRYAVSVFHQIHCLGMIRVVYYDMLARTSSASSSDVHDHTHGHHGIDAEHIAHCFDYLRQALMCAGDMTIEHAREPPLGKKRITTDGWGVVHQCRHWEELVEWTLVHKANHSLSGILG